MEHPLISDAKALSDQDLSDRIADLTKKINIARRTGNGYLVNQVEMAIESYQSEYRHRMHQQYLRATGSENFGNIIQVTRE